MMQQYDREVLQELKKVTDVAVEEALLRQEWDPFSQALITPYLLFHVLDTLERIEKQIGDIGDMTAQQWGYTKVEDT